MIVDNEEKNPVMKTSTPTLPVLGEAICEPELDKETRDKLVQKFIEIARDELMDYDKSLQNIQIYKYLIPTDPQGNRSIPKLIIHTPVKNISEFKTILKMLREYFQIQGGLRLTTMRNHYVDDEGEYKYFSSEENENELNILLDFIEYKCNKVYRGTKVKEKD